MGHRVFHPVYYVLVMSEGQIIGLVWYIFIIILQNILDQSYLYSNGIVIYIFLNIGLS